MNSKTLVGILLIILGLLKCIGKSSSRRELRFFYKYKVTNKNKLLYLKQSGKGIIIFGISFIVGCNIYEFYNTIIGCVILVFGLITFILMSSSAFSKYIKRNY